MKYGYELTNVNTVEMCGRYGRIFPKLIASRLE